MSRSLNTGIRELSGYKDENPRKENDQKFYPRSLNESILSLAPGEEDWCCEKQKEAKAQGNLSSWVAEMTLRATPQVQAKDDTNMAQGPKKHLKRLAAPSSWMLDKLGGTYRCFEAPLPSPGPHKLRECLPLTMFLRNRLKYALTGREVTSIVIQRLIKIDEKVRTDPTYPAGFMVRRTFPSLIRRQRPICHSPYNPEEATYKLLKVKKVAILARGVPHVVTHDGRTIRYPDPLIKVNDTIKFDIEQEKFTDFVKFDTGNLVMITSGRNMGRAGVIVHRQK
ncbi:ribosomal family S4e-domain-containing protein [Lentinula aff. lateritia]|uniref:Ribosomal family S4e-domain-containing protein n=1 Tax=Lentinula aff. lateritia TaxID=2804960 RepID=A0ACC1TR60_9AGAR|nr:ribosomal family S4e-domain-containing protein [Lentinula aff. lateritia]